MANNKIIEKNTILMTSSQMNYATWDPMEESKTVKRKTRDD